MSINITAVPIYVWIGAAAVVIILIGWFLNVWRVIGIKDSFPYLEIAKSLPELHSLEPQVLLSGESLTLHGDKLEVFDLKSSRIVIGANTAEIINWDRDNKEIVVKVPEGLIPGRYPVSIQIGERQSVEKQEVNVQLLPSDLSSLVQGGERILVLIAQFDRGENNGKIQNDLVEQLMYAAKQYPLLEKRLILRSWPDSVSGDISRSLEDIAKLTHAQLILFGKLGTGNNFYPRIYSSPLNGDVFEAKEQQLIPASTSQLNVADADTYPMSMSLLKDPLYVIRFLLALGHFHLNEYNEAISQFSTLLEEVGLEIINKVSVYLALGRTQILQGVEILEKPVRSEKDLREGNALLVQGIDNLEKAIDSIGDKQEEQNLKAHIYFNLAIACQARTDITIKQKHGDAIRLMKNALQLMDCKKLPISCLTAYANLGASYEWLATTTLWERGKIDDMLEKSIAMIRKAIEMNGHILKQNAYRSPSKQIGADALEFQNAYLHDNLGIAIGHYYRGDRDAHLQESLKYSEQALPVYKKQANDMSGRIALTYNNIGEKYMLQQGDRRVLLQKAVSSFDEGLTYVRPDHFPEFHNLLQGNKRKAERLLGLDYKVYEGETSQRYAAQIDKCIKEENESQAQQQMIEYLNWSWREFRTPVLSTAHAHAYMSQAAENSNNAESALLHAMSARSIMSNYDRVDEQDHHFIVDIEERIETYLSSQGKDPWQINDVLNGCRNGLTINAENRDRAGESFFANDFKKAIEYDTKALYYYPHEPFTLINRAHAKSLMGDIDGYIHDLESALLVYPDDPIALFNRAQIYLLGEQWDNVISDITRAFINGAFINDAEKQDYYNTRAKAYLGLGSHEKALADYNVSLKLTNNEAERKDIMSEIDKIKAMQTQ